MVRLLALLVAVVTLAGCGDKITMNPSHQIPYESKGLEVQKLLEQLGQTPKGKVPPSQRAATVAHEAHAEH